MLNGSSDPNVNLSAANEAIFEKKAETRIEGLAPNTKINAHTTSCSLPH